MKGAEIRPTPREGSAAAALATGGPPPCRPERSREAAESKDPVQGRSGPGREVDAEAATLAIGGPAPCRPERSREAAESKDPVQARSDSGREVDAAATTRARSSGYAGSGSFDSGPAGLRSGRHPGLDAVRGTPRDR